MLRERERERERERDDFDAERERNSRGWKSEACGIHNHPRRRRRRRRAHALSTKYVQHTWNGYIPLDDICSRENHIRCRLDPQVCQNSILICKARVI